jgi:hypothetical protein
LRSLNLEWNPIGEEGAGIFLSALRRGNTSLTELNVGSCGVSLATQRCVVALGCNQPNAKHQQFNSSHRPIQNFASKDF